MYLPAGLHVVEHARSASSQIGQVMKPQGLVSIISEKTLPCIWIEITGDLLSFAGPAQSHQ